jgi:hypothetical protein
VHKLDWCRFEGRWEERRWHVWDDSLSWDLGRFISLLPLPGMGQPQWLPKQDSRALLGQGLALWLWEHGQVQRQGGMGCAGSRGSGQQLLGEVLKRFHVPYNHTTQRSQLPALGVGQM